MSGDALASQITVFPAPAGINRSIRWVALTRFSVPRASGDKPTRGVTRRALNKCSPRQRG
ncbi:hypothetical protein HRL69_001299 [Salmonella enterica]|nr:hypothetical protein [Salmonella enterica]